MRLYHTGAKIETITRDHMFAGFLFFADEACHYGDTTYSVDIDDGSILEQGRMFYIDNSNETLKPFINEVMELVDVDEDTAMELLDESTSLIELGIFNDEKDWAIQALTGKAAVALGYRGVEVKDEYGISYMIDMFGHESELMEVCED
jgi:hypothetical protein